MFLHLFSENISLIVNISCLFLNVELNPVVKANNICFYCVCVCLCVCVGGGGGICVYQFIQNKAMNM